MVDDVFVIDCEKGAQALLSMVICNFHLNNEKWYYQFALTVCVNYHL